MSIPLWLLRVPNSFADNMFSVFGRSSVRQVGTASGFTGQVGKRQVRGAVLVEGPRGGRARATAKEPAVEIDDI